MSTTLIRSDIYKAIYAETAVGVHAALDSKLALNGGTVTGSTVLSGVIEDYVVNKVRILKMESLFLSFSFSRS